jgi:hypothetical protein
LKNIRGESPDLKGKIVCDNNACEFLIAIPVKSFKSGDESRDNNMLIAVEESKHPHVIARGKFPETNLSQSLWKLSAEVEFHGIKKNYEVQISKKSTSEFHSTFIVNLDQHQVEKPALLGVAISNDVPVNFNLFWKQK